MTFKANIGVDPRVFYTQVGGDDSEAGTSLETAKATLGASITAINALSPPPNAFERASLIVSGAGVFAENVSFPNFTNFDISGGINAVPTGNLYTIGSFSSYRCGLSVVSGASTIVFDIANETDVSITCAEVQVSGTSAIGVSVSGTTDDTFVRIEQLRIIADSAAGISHTGANGEAEVFLVGSATLERDNTTCFIHNPSNPNARSVFDVGAIAEIGVRTGTVGVRVDDGHLSCFVNEIIADTAIDVNGGTCNVIANCVTGNIDVAVGSTLIAEIAEFTGTITNNGTIIGRIGDQYFTTGVVTTSDTLTDNTLIIGNGGVDVDAFDIITATTSGNDRFLNFNHDVASMGNVGIRWFDSTATQVANLDFEFVNGELRLNAPSDSIDLTAAFVELQTTNDILMSSSGNETQALLNLGRGGAQEGSIEVYLSDRTPISNVTGQPGDWAIQDSGVTSDLFIHRGASADNTSWQGIFASIEAADTLAEVLLNGNTTGGTDISISEGDKITTVTDGRWLENTNNNLADFEIGVSIGSTSAGANAILHSITSNSALNTNHILSSIVQNGATNTSSIALRVSHLTPDASALFIIGRSRFFSVTGQNTAVISISDTIITSADTFLLNSTANTTGSTLSAISNSMSMSTRDVARFINDNVLATAATVVSMRQDSTGAILRLDRQGAFSNIFVDSISPIGNITSLEGALTIRSDAGDSGLFIHKGASSNTDWFPFITGPNTAVTAGTLPYFDTTDSAILAGDSILTYSTSGNDRFLDFNHDVASLGTVALRWFTETPQQSARIDVDFTSEDFNISALLGPLNLSGQGGMVFSQSQGSGNFTFNDAGDENSHFFVLNRTGAQGALANVSVSNRTPIGNVTKSPGSLSIEVNAASSSLFQHKGASSNNSDWFPFITGPNVAVTANQLLAFNGTSGETASAIPGLVSSSAGINDVLVYTHQNVTTGDVGFQLIDQATVTTAGFILNELTKQLQIINTGGEVDLVAGPTNLVSIGNTGVDGIAVLEIQRTGASGASSDTFISPNSPIGIALANPGDFSIQVLGAQSGKFVHKGTSANNTDWHAFSTNPPSIVEIASSTELDSLATAGVITIATGATLTLDIKTTFLNSSTRFVLEGTAELRLHSIDADVTWIYSGTGDFISGAGTRVSIDNVTIISVSTGAFINTTRTGLAIEDTFISGFDNLGSMIGTGNSLNFITIFNSSLFDCDSGFTLTDTNIGVQAANFVLTGLAGTVFEILPNTETLALGVSFVAGNLGSSGSLIGITPALDFSSTAAIFDNGLAGVLFEQAGGTTGTFTVVADAAVASTTINSVTDSSGVARFNFTVGPTLFVNQKIVNAGFITNTAYNGTFLITATGAGFFEVARIAFGTDEASGSFTSDSVTLTDTGTTLSDGDTLVIDTDGSSDYDGGNIVYNQLTNSFQINKLFTVTATGSWDTTRLGKEDSRILSSRNRNFEDSKYIAAAFVNNNATANPAIVNNTFTNMAFGTAGSALVEATTIERWKLIDDVLGTFEYTGLEPFDGYITFDFSSVSSGGATNFRYKWVHDVGAGFVDLPDAVEALASIGSDAISVTKTFPLKAVKGDQIKPQITRNSGASAITTEYASIYATQ